MRDRTRRSRVLLLPTDELTGTAYDSMDMRNDELVVFVFRHQRSARWNARKGKMGGNITTF
jgi:hypothetical protein